MCQYCFVDLGDNVQKNSDGSISVGGQKLPPGTVVVNNPDGSISVKGIVLDIPQTLLTETLITSEKHIISPHFHNGHLYI